MQVRNLSLAIAELMLSGDEWTPRNLASRFVECFKRDPREGYAGRFYDFLIEVADGEDFLARIQPHSDKSGAAMRAVPVGLFGSIEEVRRKAEIQARVTHDTPDGVNAAVAAALMAHYFHNELGPREEVGDFLVQHVDGQWNCPWSGKVGAKGWMSVRAAITAVQEGGSLSDILKRSIAFTGDVDTVATIALGAASLSDEIEKDLPAALFNGLEDGGFGRTYLLELDRKLLS